MTTVIGQQHSTRGGTAQAPMSDETCAAIYSIVQDLRAQADALFASLPVNAQAAVGDQVTQTLLFDHAPSVAKIITPE